MSWSGVPYLCWTDCFSCLVWQVGQKADPGFQPRFSVGLAAGAISSFPPALFGPPRPRPPSASQRPGSEFPQSGGELHRLGWSEPGWSIWGRAAAFSTDGTPLGSTMDLGGLFLRYQRTLLITMMMFKLGKTQLQTPAAACGRQSLGRMWMWFLIFKLPSTNFLRKVVFKLKTLLFLYSFQPKLVFFFLKLQRWVFVSWGSLSFAEGVGGGVFVDPRNFTKPRWPIFPVTFTCVKCVNLI